MSSDKHFDCNINPQAPLFVIGVVSDMVRMPIWTLRKLDELGVVSPKRIGKTRCYSMTQIKTLNYVSFLLQEQKVNISGIKVILGIKAASPSESS